MNLSEEHEDNLERRETAAQHIHSARNEMDGTTDKTLIDELSMAGLAFIEEILLRRR